MKKALLFIIALCTAYISYSAAGSQSLTTGVVIGGGGFPHFSHNSGKAGSTLNYRVVAKVFARYDGYYFKASDSVRYQYNNGRGSLIDIDRPNFDETLLFDDATTYLYNNFTNTYENRLNRKQVFDTDNKIASLKYSYWNFNTIAWKDSARYLYKYISGTNKIDESLFQLWVGGTWAHNVPSTLTYSGNFVTSINSVAYSASYNYDANNNVISIIDKVSEHGTGQLENNERKTYSYNNSNMVQTYTLELWDKASSIWTKTKYYEYTYTQSNISESKEYRWDGSNWALHSKHLLTYNTLNDITSEIIMLWNGSTYINHTREVYIYNATNLIETITLNSWDAAIGAWKPMSGNTQLSYYYEYYAPTGLESITSNTTEAILYPVPAVDKLHIQLSQNISTAATFSIYNANGAVIRQWNDRFSTGNSNPIDVSNLPAGTYLLSVSSRDITLSKPFNIIK